jgi:hypothetical protein
MARAHFWCAAPGSTLDLFVIFQCAQTADTSAGAALSRQAHGHMNGEEEKKGKKGKKKK